MDRARMLTELDEVLDDTGTSHTAWTETTKLGYLEEGQEKFCEDTGFFVDATNFTLVTEPGVPSYSLDPRVIQVLGVYDGPRRLWKRTVEPLLKQESTFSFAYESQSAVSGYQLDMEAGLLTLIGTPTDVRTLVLRVWRYPLNELSANDVDGEGTPAAPELPRRLQRACIEWAVFKCLSHHDREQQDPVKAVDHLGMYRMYVTEGKKYLRRLRDDRTEVTPNLAYRV